MSVVVESDIDFLFGKRRPGAVPTKSARQDQERVNKAAEVFFKTLLAVAPKVPQTQDIIADMMTGTLAIVALIPAHDRVGMLEGQSRLTDMEATIRLATEMPDQFAAFDLSGLKKRAMDLRKAGAS